MASKCEQYIAHKKRRCNFDAKPGFAFCGNHMPNALQPERRRVPCPFGYPHSCFESEMERHKLKCPSHAHAEKIKAQPYVQHDVNAGPAADAAHLCMEKNECPSSGQASNRHAHAVAMGPDKFASLIDTIEQAHSKVCADPEQLQPLSPPECDAYLQPDNIRPFSLKHAKQQASIVGHMREAGLLQDTQTTYIEFGAGKGYLSSMVADASDARRFVLLDMRSFRMKADRALKKVNDMKLARLNVDIKDFQPAGVPDLDGGAAPWVCIGKHLCGAATDFTLQCCTSSLHAVKHISQPPKQAVKPATVCSADQVHANSSTDRHTEVLSAATDAIQDSVRSASDSTAGRQSAAVVNCSTSPADRDISQARSLDADQENASSINSTQASYRSRQGLQGMAVATCCHHRCSWQHYVGKASFRELGFSPEDFEVMSWMTGWALCGHETPNVGDAPDQSPEADATASSSSAAAFQHADGFPTLPSAGSAEQQEQTRLADDPGAWADNHVTALSRSKRMLLGQKCKRLIDFGRHQYLMMQGFQVKSVLYISPDISGENRLLLAIL